ncbi:MAG: translesion error-prone DNA polymerase V autoproteolytic subunit [Bacteroidales bacterium]|nr:translesion error-prone DNA polymerase V autoproteolytic subunit [Bacteroidales bacterium]
MDLLLFSADTSSETSLLLADEGVHAGFPSPAQDYMCNAIDLNKELIRHPETTFYARCVGDSMKDIGIDNGDLLIIDKSIEPQDGDIVVAYIDGNFTLKRIKMEHDGKSLWLMPENDEYKPIKVTEENSFIVWGVVTHNIKTQFRRQ